MQSPEGDTVQAADRFGKAAAPNLKSARLMARADHSLAGAAAMAEVALSANGEEVIAQDDNSLAREAQAARTERSAARWVSTARLPAQPLQLPALLSCMGAPVFLFAEQKISAAHAHVQCISRTLS